MAQGQTERAEHKPAMSDWLSRRPEDEAIVADWLGVPRELAAQVIREAGLVVLHSNESAQDALGERGGNGRDLTEHLPAIWIPHYLPGAASAVGRHLRLNKVMGYGARFLAQVGSRKHVYFGPRMLRSNAPGQASVPIWVTDGERRCLVADAYGAHAVSIHGALGWRCLGTGGGLHPDFLRIKWEGRLVFFAVDWMGGASEMARFKGALEFMGADVCVVPFPEHPSATLFRPNRSANAS